MDGRKRVFLNLSFLFFLLFLSLFCQSSCNCISRPSLCSKFLPFVQTCDNLKILHFDGSQGVAVLEWDVSIVAQCEGQEGGQLKHWIQSHNNFLTIIPDSVRYNSSLFSDLQNEKKTREDRGKQRREHSISSDTFSTKKVHQTLDGFTLDLGFLPPDVLVQFTIQYQLLVKSDLDSPQKEGEKIILKSEATYPMAKQSQYFSSFELPIPRSETQRRRGDTANWEETDEDSNSGCYWVGPPISSTICIDSAPGDLCEIQVNLTQDGEPWMSMDLPVIADSEEETPCSPVGPLCELCAELDKIGDELFCPLVKINCLNGIISTPLATPDCVPAPLYDDCTESCVQCGIGGSCVSGKCMCEPDFSGDDCTFYCPSIPSTEVQVLPLNTPTFAEILPQTSQTNVQWRGAIDFGDAHGFSGGVYLHITADEESQQEENSLTDLREKEKRVNQHFRVLIRSGCHPFLFENEVEEQQQLVFGGSAWDTLANFENSISIDVGGQCPEDMDGSPQDGVFIALQCFGQRPCKVQIQVEVPSLIPQSSFEESPLILLSNAPRTLLQIPTNHAWFGATSRLEMTLTGPYDEDGNAVVEEFQTNLGLDPFIFQFGGCLGCIPSVIDGQKQETLGVVTSEIIDYSSEEIIDAETSLVTLNAVASRPGSPLDVGDNSLLFGSWYVTLRGSSPGQNHYIKVRTKTVEIGVPDNEDTNVEQPEDTGELDGNDSNEDENNEGDKDQMGDISPSCLANCVHGSCNSEGICICDENWEGIYCLEYQQHPLEGGESLGSNDLFIFLVCLGVGTGLVALVLLVRTLSRFFSTPSNFQSLSQEMSLMESEIDSTDEDSDE